MNLNNFVRESRGLYSDDRLHRQEKNMKSCLSKVAFLSAALFSVPTLSFAASIVYDNTTGDQNRFYASPNEYGDEITLSGTDRTVTGFDFYYYFSGAAAGSATATIRFYDNTGAGGAPGTSFFTSDPIQLQPSAGGSFGTHETITLPVSANVVAPNAFTWTIQFANLGINQAGLLIYSPPTVGSSFNDFWENSGTWNTLQINGGVPNDFAARVTAVPEPGTLALGSLALLVGVAAAGYRRKFRQ